MRPGHLRVDRTPTRLPQPPKRAAAGPADPGGVSSAAATAKALREGDADALRKALEKRGDDSPLSQEEMLAIAQLMLGADASTEFGKGLAMGLASGPEAAAEAWQRGQTKAPQVSKPPPQAADEDSDDGGGKRSKIKDTENTRRRSTGQLRRRASRREQASQQLRRRPPHSARPNGKRRPRRLWHEHEASRQHPRPSRPHPPRATSQRLTFRAARTRSSMKGAPCGCW